MRPVRGTWERVEQGRAQPPEVSTQAAQVPAGSAAAQQVRQQAVTTNAEGKPALIKDVAKERHSSIEDAQMRHGRKSRSVRVEGDKRHVARALDSALVGAVGLTPAHAPEARLAQARKSALKSPQLTRKCTSSVLTCRASGSASALRSGSFSARLGRCAQAGPFFPKTAFTVDWERARRRCPPGVERACQPGKVVPFPTASCAPCPPRARGTGSPRGRRASLHSAEKLRQELRVGQGPTAGRATLRERVGVEPELSPIGPWQGARARYPGARKNLLDLRRCAVVNKLHSFARRPQILAQAA